MLICLMYGNDDFYRNPSSNNFINEKRGGINDGLANSSKYVFYEKKN